MTSMLEELQKTQTHFCAQWGIFPSLQISMRIELKKHNNAKNMCPTALCDCAPHQSSVGPYLDLQKPVSCLGQLYFGSCAFVALKKTFPKLLTVLTADA